MKLLCKRIIDDDDDDYYYYYTKNKNNLIFKLNQKTNQFR